MSQLSIVPLGPSAALQVPKALSLVPAHCLELLAQCASYGVPVLGMPTSSGAKEWCIWWGGC